jgi:hypothetical protein
MATGWAAAAGQEAAVRKAIEADGKRYAAACKAFVKTKDPRVLATVGNKVYAPDCTVTFLNGTVLGGRGACIQADQERLSGVKRITRWDVRISQVKMRGDNRAEVVRVWDLAWDTANPKAAGARHIKSQISDKSTFLKTASGWQLERMVETNNRTRLEGRVPTPTPAVVGEEAAVRKALEANGRLYAQACKDFVRTKKPYALTSLGKRLYTPDCTVKLLDGTVFGGPKACVQGDLQRLSGVKSITRWDMRISQLKMQGPKKAEIIRVWDLAWDTANPRAAGGRHVVAQITDRSTFVRTIEGWQLQRMIQLTGRILVDGKPARTRGTALRLTLRTSPAGRSSDEPAAA